MKIQHYICVLVFTKRVISYTPKALDMEGEIDDRIVLFLTWEMVEKNYETFKIRYIAHNDVLEACTLLEKNWP